jgi:predicted nucleic-acid-binding protein
LDALEKFRLDFYYIRKVIGWSLDDIANMLNMSHTGIINILTKEGKMTTVYYNALMNLIDDQFPGVKHYSSSVRYGTETELIRILLDSDSMEKHAVMELVNTIVARKGTKMGSKDLSTEIVLAYQHQ